MASISVYSVSGRTYPLPNLESRNIDYHKAAKQLDAEREFQLDAPGRVAKGREMYEKAFQLLNETLGRTELTATRTIDTETGASQFTLVSDRTGKVIKKIPADAVLDIARRAQSQATGWIINTFA